MLHDTVERVWVVVNTNFAADMAAVITAKGLGAAGLTATATIIKRQTAEIFAAKQATVPTIGVYGIRAVTQAKDQGKRDSQNTVGIDYYATGMDASKLQKQVEVAAEALLRSVDRIAGSGGGVFGAAVQDGSITVDLLDGYTEGAAPAYIGVATVTFPVDDREDGL